MPVAKQPEISPAEGKLGVLLVGLGAVSTTFIAGVEAIKKGFAQPIGSLTQMGTIRLGKRTDNRVPLIKDFVPLAQLKDLVFGAWDIFPESAYDAALNAGVLEKELLAQLKEPLRKIKPMTAVFDQSYVKRLSGANVKTGKTKFDLAQQLIDEIGEWKKKNRCSRLVMIWAASTEVFLKPHPVHKTLDSFEKAMKENHKAIAPSMIYAYAALKSGVPFANGAPNLTVDIPALMNLADKNRLAICGNSNPFTFLGERPFQITPLADPDAGLDVTAVRSLAFPHVMRFLWRAFGSGGQIRLRNVVGLHDLASFEILCSRPMPLQVDGDYVGEATRFEFESVPRSLSLLV